MIHLRSRFVRFLIVKSVIEMLLIAGLALAFYFTNFNPHFRGRLDPPSKPFVNSSGVSGWVIDEAAQQRSVEVQLYVDDRFVGSHIADQYRPDVATAGGGMHAANAQHHHGFSFNIPSLAAGEHQACVYAVHKGKSETRRTLHLIDHPWRFEIEAKVEAKVEASGSAGAP